MDIDASHFGSPQNIRFQLSAPDENGLERLELVAHANSGFHFNASNGDFVFKGTPLRSVPNRSELERIVREHGPISMALTLEKGVRDYTSKQTTVQTPTPARVARTKNSLGGPIGPRGGELQPQMAEVVKAINGRKMTEDGELSGAIYDCMSSLSDSLSKADPSVTAVQIKQVYDTAGNLDFEIRLARNQKTGLGIQSKCLTQEDFSLVAEIRSARDAMRCLASALNSEGLAFPEFGPVVLQPKLGAASHLSPALGGSTLLQRTSPEPDLSQVAPPAPETEAARRSRQRSLH
jgi:hypothetical protein